MDVFERIGIKKSNFAVDVVLDGIWFLKNLVLKRSGFLRRVSLIAVWRLIQGRQPEDTGVELVVGQTLSGASAPHLKVSFLFINNVSFKQMPRLSNRVN